jgi:uncharacterized protein
MPKKQDDLIDLFNKKEELHKDLVPWLCKGPYGGTSQSLKHPLVFDVLYCKEMNAILNRAYAVKTRMIEDYTQKKEWAKAIFLYEKPYRMMMLERLRTQLTDVEYWSLLAQVWVNIENLFEYKDLIPILLNADRPGKQCMMDDKEFVFYKTLPEKVTLYRGYQQKNRRGFSWTLNYHQAKWFHRRLNNVVYGGVCQVTVPYTDIHAVLLGRGEFEAILTLTPKQWKTVKEVNLWEFPEGTWQDWLLQWAAGQYPPELGQLHGPDHWFKVYRNGMGLCDVDPDVDRVIVECFALIHDSQRINNDDDPHHGERAADVCETLWIAGKLPLSEQQKDILVMACHFHHKGTTTKQPTVGACWDADRMDLVRVGTIPNKTLFSTQVGKDLLWQV